jgi:predicted secreted protein
MTKMMNDANKTTYPCPTWEYAKGERKGKLKDMRHEKSHMRHIVHHTSSITYRSLEIKKIHSENEHSTQESSNSAVVFHVK